MLDSEQFIRLFVYYIYIYTCLCIKAVVGRNLIIFIDLDCLYGAYFYFTYLVV